jgi:hypothetical protein
MSQSVHYIHVMKHIRFHTKYILLMLLCIGSIDFAEAQPPGFQWAKSLGGINVNSIINPVAIATDAQGNVYTAGYFYGTADFDPGAGIVTLTSNGSDAFISKLDAQGNFIWAKNFASNGSAWGITLDAGGNIYATGVFSAAFADFDPGPGTYTMNAPGAFVLKLDPSGNFTWAKALGGVNSYGMSVAVNNNGDVYTVGFFDNSSSDFDPGPGTYTLGSGGGDDIFISKLDGSGNFQWAERIGGVLGQSATNVKLDASGNIYFSGQVYGTVDFDPGPGNYLLTGSGSASRGFVCKLSSGGNLIWANCTQGPGTCLGSIITLDSTGNIYSGGSFMGVVDLDPGPGSFQVTSAGLQDVFISKLDQTGSFLWGKTIGGSDADFCGSLATDTLGNIYYAGTFNVTADFDPGPGSYSLTSLCGGFPTEAFLAKLDIAGNFAWARAIAPTCDSRATGIAVDASSNVYTTGYFSGTGDFDPDPNGVSTLTNNCQISGFVHKMSQDNIPASTVESAFISMLAVYPNPACDQLFITGNLSPEKKLQVRIYDALGQLMNAPEINAGQTQLDIHLLKSGIYWIHLQDNSGNLIQRFIKQ